MEKIYGLLIRENVGKVLANEQLFKHTTMKIGGPAKLFIEPSSIEKLQKTLQIIQKANLQYKIIGRGSNMLFPDEGYKGAIIKIDSALEQLEINGTELYVGAGYSLISLAIQAYRHSLTGLEFAAGIPGSVGGAIYMNAGAHGSDIANILTKAHVLFSDGTLKWLTNEQLKFSYRRSILQEEKEGIIVEATFNLEKGNKEQINEIMKKNKLYRKNTQPWDLPCSGSVFRNPLPNYAAKLIEEANLKGFAIGGAKVSEIHSNFIVNSGDATYEDVINLIKHIKTTINNLYGINLETEIEIIVQK